MIRKALPSDLDALCEIAKTFIGETSYDVTYSGLNSRSHLWQYIATPSADVIIVTSDEDDVILGGVMLAASVEFQLMPFCYISKFYVAPEARRSLVARQLMESAIKWAADMTCSDIFSTATAGLSPTEQRLFINLMKRYGFNDAGPCLHLKI